MINSGPLPLLLSLARLVGVNTETDRRTNKQKSPLCAGFIGGLCACGTLGHCLLASPRITSLSPFLDSNNNNPVIDMLSTRVDNIGKHKPPYSDTKAKSSLAEVTLLSVTVSRREIIERRRQEAYNQFATGLNADEIANLLKYNRRTVYRDLAFMKRRKRQENEDYETVLKDELDKIAASLEILRKDDWHHYRGLKWEGSTENAQLKDRLHDHILEVTDALLEVRAMRSIVNKQAIEDAKQLAAKLKQEYKDNIVNSIEAEQSIV